MVGARLLRGGLPVALLLALALGLAGCRAESQESSAAQKQPPPPRVTVTAMAPETVTLERTYAARTQGAREVEVRARVQGILEQRGYQEGTVVSKGTKLFTIDPEPFRIQVDRAEAELERAKASLRQAQREWQRISRLYDSDAVSERQRDDARSTLELARADVALAEADVRDARLDLDYTSVEAPIGGVTSLEVLSEGSLVEPRTLLTTITQLDPIHVRFSIPEEDALAQRQRVAATGAAEKPARLTATLRLPGGERYPREGVVDFTESAIDPSTGTMRARAVFPNPHGRLLPGQFVRVSLNGLTREGAIVVPEKAVAQGPDGAVVYTVADDDTAKAVPVTLGESVDGGVVVRSGLSGGDRVVVGGIASVRPGQPVRPVPASTAQARADVARSGGAG